jgi:hypothetical protein
LFINKNLFLHGTGGSVSAKTKKFKSKVRTKPRNSKFKSSSYEPTWAHNLKEHIPVVQELQSRAHRLYAEPQ